MTDSTTANLNLEDLKSILGVIQLAASRGAFQAAELSKIGQTHDKLNLFISIAEASLAKTKELEQNNPTNQNIPLAAAEAGLATLLNETANVSPEVQ